MGTAQGRPGPKTWKPTTAGIIDIVVGALNMIGTIFLIIGAALLGSASSWAGFTPEDFGTIAIGTLVAILGVLAFITAVLGILAIIGGIYSLQRRKFGLALTGSIAGILCSTIPGIVAIVFLSMAKDEFE